MTPIAVVARWLAFGACALGMCAHAGCGDDADDPARAAERDAGTAHDGGTARDTPELTLELPREPRPGTPFVVAISAANAWSGAATLSLAGRVAARATLYRGRGSASLTIERAGTVALAVHAGASTLTRTLDVVERPLRPLTGNLTGEQLSWSADADIELSDGALVLASEQLVIAAGTRVLLGANAALEIEGELAVAGERDDPVSFTRAGQDAWGGIRVLPGGSARLEHAWLSAGGGDAARAYGHSDSQPVLWAEDATLEVNGGGIVDNPGKALGSEGAHITVRDALISRCDTGGQLGRSAALIERTHVLELPDADGRFDDDDNDGIYLLGVLAGDDGAEVASVIRDSVFALGEDDAIDHNDAELRVERVWIEDFRHEGLAASAGHRVVITDSVVRRCEQGIEAGYGTPQVEVDRCLLTDNDVGLRVGDSYDWDTNGTLSVRNTIAYGNRQANVRNYVEQLQGPLPGALSIACSLVDDPAYDGMDGNLSGPPAGDFEQTGCATAPRTVAPECDGAAPGPQPCP